MEFNEQYTNTKPRRVECEDVCRVDFIVVGFDATSLCHGDNSKLWDCGLGQLEDHLAPLVANHATEDTLIGRMYSVNNPTNELPPFLKCEDNQKNVSYLEISSCKTVLEKYYNDPQKSPFEVTIETIETRMTQKKLSFHRFYMKKLYFWQKGTIKEDLSAISDNETLEDDTFNQDIFTHDITKKNITVLEPSKEDSTIPIWAVLVIVLCIVVLVIFIATTAIYVFKRRRKEVVQFPNNDAEKELGLIQSNCKGSKPGLTAGNSSPSNFYSRQGM